MPRLSETGLLEQTTEQQLALLEHNFNIKVEAGIPKRQAYLTCIVGIPNEVRVKFLERIGGLALEKTAISVEFDPKAAAVANALIGQIKAGKETGEWPTMSTIYNRVGTYPAYLTKHQGLPEIAQARDVIEQYKSDYTDRLRRQKAQSYMASMVPLAWGAIEAIETAGEKLTLAAVARKMGKSSRYLCRGAAGSAHELEPIRQYVLSRETDRKQHPWSVRALNPQKEAV